MDERAIKALAEELLHPAPSSPPDDQQRLERHFKQIEFSVEKCLRYINARNSDKLFYAENIPKLGISKAKIYMTRCYFYVFRSRNGGVASRGRKTQGRDC